VTAKRTSPSISGSGSGSAFFFLRPFFPFSLAGILRPAHGGGGGGARRRGLLITIAPGALSGTVRLQSAEKLTGLMSVAKKKRCA
jgi:hypothetical protein